MPISEHLFRYVTALEVEKALRLRYSISLVCLSPDLDIQSTDPSLAKQIARMAGQQLRRTDVVTTLRGGTVGLLLVDADPHALPSILDRTSGTDQPGVRRFSRAHELISVSAGGSCYPVTASSGGLLFEEATRLMRRAREAGGDRFLLPPALTSRVN
jgi:hypothetical protein